MELGYVGIAHNRSIKGLLHVHVENNAQCQSLTSGNPILKSYDIILVRPMNQNAFDYACEKAEVDLISIDFTDKMLFRLKHPMRGMYSDLLMDAQTGDKLYQMLR
ncbi:unnamed protein product [Arabidopsis thaliana]|uniref:Uncharacterized protein n=1 Tax=Arabidopsis thaliana TaxID=3702 RepID=A0A654FKZ2_ARATH|nr:unnamed protein product [Arabidopsis thaliana]